MQYTSLNGILHPVLEKSYNCKYENQNVLNMMEEKESDQFQQIVNAMPLAIKIILIEIQDC
jgi:hypothetical protein